MVEGQPRQVAAVKEGSLAGIVAGGSVHPPPCR